MSTLPSGLPDVIADDEDIARFLTQSSQFNTKMAKPAAFLPNPKDRETSVSRHGREPSERLWNLGLAAAGNRNLYGAAIFKAHVVRDAGLELTAVEPPDFHAAIRRWPWFDHDPAEQKAQQKERAILLASAAGEPVLQ